MLNFIKQNRLALFAVAVLAFSGCNEDRSHPKDGEINGDITVVYGDPVAVIDLNATNHLSQGEDNNTLKYRYTVGSPFIFDSANSYDTDENNQSIVSYAWNITSTFVDNCLEVDINNTTNIASVTVCNDGNLNNGYNGDINATLTVTDDENKTASTTTRINLN